MFAEKGETEGEGTKIKCRKYMLYKGMLRNTHVPVDLADTRRLDFVVPGLNVARGPPLFCDSTVLTPLTARGVARPGTSNSAGGLLVAATLENNSTYHEVVDSGLGALYCLGAEVYGRLSTQADCCLIWPVSAAEA